MRSLLIILSRRELEPWAQQLVNSSGAVSAHIHVASPAAAARIIAEQRLNPSHIVLDIGKAGQAILSEIDALANECEAGTRVIATGESTDATLLRELTSRGITGYIPSPAAIADMVRMLTPTASQAKPQTPTRSDQRVIVFMSAASGDGASMAALNSAYTISQSSEGATVLVDMDYQFGMVAKQLALQNQYGIRDLFDHPERGVDATLIKHMVVRYRKLDIITAPSELRYLPTVSAEAIEALIATLKQSYDTIILDLPHVWLPWVTAAIQQSTHLVLVAQLWLKSVSHAARMIRSLRELGIPAERVTAVINRSGAKYKEAIAPKDFERVCGVPIRHNLVNDIRTIVVAEASAKTLMELPPSELAADIQALAYGLIGMRGGSNEPPKRSSFFSKR